MTADLPPLLSADSKTVAFRIKSGSSVSVPRLSSPENICPSVFGDTDSEKRNFYEYRSKHDNQRKNSGNGSSADGRKFSVPDDSLINVDHTHYEQWARVPGKTKMTNSLLRGIQKLKAKLIREGREDELLDLRNYRQDFDCFRLNRNNTFCNSNGKSTNDAVKLRRERTSLSIDSADLRKQLLERNPLKTKSQLIDSGVLTKRSSSPKVRKSKSCNGLTDFPKLKHGVSKLRDRCALPVSIYQPVNIGDHLFLINEPYTNGLSNSEGKIPKKLPHTNGLTHTDDKIPRRLSFSESLKRLPDLVDSGKENMASIQRSRTDVSEISSSKNQHRAFLAVPNAELFDFSKISTKLAEIRYSVPDHILGRSKTDIIFYQNHTFR